MCTVSLNLQKSHPQWQQFSLSNCCYYLWTTISEPLPAQNLMIASFTETSLIAEWDPPNSAQTDHTRYEASIQVNYLCFNLTWREQCKVRTVKRVWNKCIFCRDSLRLWNFLLEILLELHLAAFNQAHCTPWTWSPTVKINQAQLSPYNITPVCIWLQ